MRWAIGSGLVLAAFAVIALAVYFRNQELYLTVDELVGQRSATAADAVSADPPPALGRRVQVRGDVDHATVQRVAAGLELRLVLAGTVHRLPVVYRGLVPDTFGQARTVTVAGVLGPDGVFVADALTVQCPSRYEAQPSPSARSASVPST